MLLIGAAFFSMWYFLTLYFQEVLGWSALRSGLAFAPMAIAIILGSQIAPRLLQRFGAWAVIILGTTFATIGFFILSNLSSTSTYAGLVLPAALAISIGLGLLFGPLAAAATSGVAQDKAGLASGLLNSSRQIGGSLGLAVLATIAVTSTANSLGGAHPSFGGAVSAEAKVALTHGYATAFLIATFITFAAMLVTVVLMPRDIAHHVRQAPIPLGE
jgi:MFS family permease